MAAPIPLNVPLSQAIPFLGQPSTNCAPKWKKLDRDNYGVLAPRVSSLEKVTKRNMEFIAIEIEEGKGTVGKRSRIIPRATSDFFSLAEVGDAQPRSL